MAEPTIIGVNYFDHQFLRRDDFDQAREYAVQRQRQHTRLLHQPGVLEGLEVSIVNGQVWVAHGRGVDSAGQEVVLQPTGGEPPVRVQVRVQTGQAAFLEYESTVGAGPLVLDLARFPDAWDKANVFIRGGVQPFEPTTDVGLEGMTRLAERAVVEVVGIDTPDPAGGLRLATLTRPAGEKSFATVTPSGQRAGAVVADASVTEAKLKDGAVITPKLADGAVTSAKIAPSIDLAVRSLTVEKGAVVKGVLEARTRLAVGGAAGDASLHVAGGNWDVGATQGDLKVGNQAYALKVGVAVGGGGAGDVRLRAMGGTNRMMLGGGANDTLTVTDQAVGIGTAAPTARLTVAGGNGDVTNSEGDVRVGDATYRLRIGVVVAGPSAGDVRLRAMGGTNRLYLGSGAADVVTIQNGRVAIAAQVDPACALNVGGVINATDVLKNGQPLTTSQWASVPGAIAYTAGKVGVGIAAPAAPLHVMDSASPAVLRVQSNHSAGFGSARLELWSDPPGSAGEWRPGYVESIDLGNFTGGLSFVTNGAGLTQRSGSVEAMRLVNGRVAIAAPINAAYALNVGGVINATDVLKNGQPLSASQWAGVPGGIAYSGGNVNILPPGQLLFGSVTRQMINLWSTEYGIGVQASTQYFRTGAHFAWFRGGAHHDGAGNPGGGARLMALNSSGDLILSARTNPQSLTNGSLCRALVDYDQQLILNFANDFTKGVLIPSTLAVKPGAGATDMLTVTDQAVGIGTAAPTARLTVAGGFWDVTNSEGDIRVGDATYRLKVGVALAGGGAGDVRLRAMGGTNRMMLGGGNNDVVVITPNSVTISGLLTANGTVVVNGPMTINGVLSAPAKVGYVVDHFVNHAGGPVEQGDVVVLGDAGAAGYWARGNDIPIPEVDLASRPYDRRVCGIVDKVTTSGALPFAEEPPAPAKRRRGRGKGAAKDSPEHPLLRYAAPEGEELDPRTVGPGQMGSMVTQGAFAYCKVDADVAPIEVGDLLTTSATPGHAQKAVDPAAAVGAIVGKAVASLKKGRGKIPVMVLLQ